MPRTAVRVFPSPNALGEHLAERLAGDGDAEESVALLELVDRDLVAFRKACSRLLAQLDGRSLAHSSGVLSGRPSTSTASRLGPA